MSTQKESVSELRRRIKSRLPESAFIKRPVRMLWAALWTGIALAAGAIILMPDTPWLAKIFLGLVIGHSLSVLNILGHEILHGGMGGSRTLQNAVASLGCLTIFIPANVWRAWHNQQHHAHTNHAVKDIDHLGLMHRYVGNAKAQSLIDKFPGSGRWSSLLFFTYGLSLLGIAQTFKRPHPQSPLAKRDLTPEKQQIGMIVAFWLALGFMSGTDFLYTVVLPLMTANVILLSYVGTEHWLRPLSDSNDVVASSMDVEQPKWLAFLHSNNGYHIEHHLFPGLPFDQLPLVRKALEEEMPGEIAVMGHWRALKWIFHTPRVYADQNHLVDLRDPSRWFDLKKFERIITDPSQNIDDYTPDDFYIRQN